uniref:NADH dehydrogenase subunit 4L n=1 Tax=Batracomorphus curvatus TaxID=3045903 RepID=UPI00257BC701|nr:NADH dehydrogenase subunit 4L [Batracomorphus curvatus]WHE42608.1 NADH dehydrogenase subunit 4L [Batracomorphus curvatus]
MIFFFFIFFFSLFSFIGVRRHILLCLMMLEFMVVSVLILIYFYLALNFYSLYLYVFFMTIFVCEGVLGLSGLVYFIRYYGNNYLNSMFMW